MKTKTVGASMLGVALASGGLSCDAFVPSRPRSRSAPLGFRSPRISGPSAPGAASLAGTSSASSSGGGDSSSSADLLSLKTPAEIDFITKCLSFSYVFDEIEPGSPELDALVGAFELVLFPRGEAICEQGDRGDYFYVVQSGDVRFEVNGTEVGTAGEGRSFGELALVDGTTRRAATVRAYGGPARLWRVDGGTFRSVLGDAKVRDVNVYMKRAQLKKKLEDAAIESFSAVLPERYCEDIMAEMEGIRPIARPAYHPSMNGDWCMVRAGVNTLDMTLVTVLSKISAAVPFLVDFTDCYISLSNGATLVTCHIFLKLFGGMVPFKMEAYTGLECDDDHPDGTLMYESFSGMKVLGVTLQAPISVARPLEITYLDEDIMLARNDGGEPHLLVRIRSSPEEDPDHEFTGFFERARELYGERITRCLVDRYFGQADDEGDRLKKALEKARSLSVSNTRDRLRFDD